MSHDFSTMSDKELISRFRFLSDNILNVISDIEDRQKEYCVLFDEWTELEKFIGKRYIDVKE